MTDQQAPNVGDTPMHRKTVRELRDDELNQLLDRKREHRLKQVRVYERAQQKAKENEQEKARKQLERQCELFEKDLATVDRALDRLEQRANKIRAFRLQYEDDYDPNAEP
jgi:3-methyladenine DNA glycosylase/8-oxoguanine DNA glycosylase